MQAVQSALAVRRQRNRREEQKRAKLRRQSGTSIGSPRSSVVSLDGHVYFDEDRENKKILGQVTMFHVGGVLILIGLMLTVTALIPGYVRSTTPEKRSNLLGTGCFFVFIGGVMTTISRFVSNNEEKELNQYIQRRLARSKSGHRLVRDPELGGFPTPTKERKAKSQQNGVATGVSNHATASRTSSSGSKGQQDQVYPEVHQYKNASAEIIGSSSEEASCAFVVGVDETMTPSSTEPVLSRILEEDEIDDGDQTTEPIDSTPETSSLSPMSPLETQGLLDRHYSPRRASRTSSSKSLRQS